MSDTALPGSLSDWTPASVPAPTPPLVAAPPAPAEAEPEPFEASPWLAALSEGDSLLASARRTGVGLALTLPFVVAAGLRSTSPVSALVVGALTIPVGLALLALVGVAASTLGVSLASAPLAPAAAADVASRGLFRAGVLLAGLAPLTALWVSGGRAAEALVTTTLVLAVAGVSGIGTIARGLVARTAEENGTWRPGALLVALLFAGFAFVVGVRIWIASGSVLSSAPGGVMSDFDVLLRDPTAAARRALGGHDAGLVRTALLCLIAGAVIYGGVIGSYRGEAQVAYAAIKMPLVLLGALAVTAPAVWALGAANGRAWTLRSVGALVLVAAGRASLVLVAVAPLLWLAIDVGSGYHFSSFLASGAFGLAGLVALLTLVRGLGRSGITAALCAAVVFLSALAQTGWALRPWLGRPSQPVVLVRTEAGVGPLESVLSSTRHGLDDPTGHAYEGSSW